MLNCNWIEWKPSTIFMRFEGDEPFILKGPQTAHTVMLFGLCTWLWIDIPISVSYRSPKFFLFLRKEGHCTFCESIYSFLPKIAYSDTISVVAIVTAVLLRKRNIFGWNSVLNLETQDTMEIVFSMDRNSIHMAFKQVFWIDPTDLKGPTTFWAASNLVSIFTCL